MADTLYLIDGHSQIYRAYFARIGQQMTSPDGEPTQATFVFTRMLLSLIRDRTPTYLAMTMDGPVAELVRRETYADYKANRPPMPDDMPPQIDRICQIVEAMGIPILKSPGHEADDVLATAAARLACDDLQVVLVSRDKDLDQLLGPNVVLYDSMKAETITAESLEETKGYRPDQAVEIQTLTGDSTDDIPGVKGIGPKTAVKLINKYGSAQAVLDHADELTPKQRENVLDFADQLPVTRELVRLRDDVPIEFDLESMRVEKLDLKRVGPVFRELGFTRLLDELGAAQEKTGSDSSDTPSTDADTDRPAHPSPGLASIAQLTCHTVDTPEKLDAMLAEMPDVKRLAVDTETTSQQPMRAELVGISLAWKPGEGWYIPVKGPLGAVTLDVDLVRNRLGPVLADADIEKIGQNLKYDWIVLRNAGFELAGPMFDTMIAAHVEDASRRSFGMDALAAELLGYVCIPISEVIGKGRNQTTMDLVPVETVAPYAAEDAEVTLRLADVLAERLEQDGLADLFTLLEMPLMPVLADMEATGIRVDPEVLKRMEAELSKEADVLHDRIVAAAGRPFNPDSPKQLAEVLFTDMGLPIIKSKKTGPSTDESVLSELAIEHELPAMVLEYRKLTKLIGTYLKSLGECIHPSTRRVHTSFHQAGTITGRLSSSDPNLQNIPIRTEQGRRIRSAFVADEGCVLLSADYSQVELRMLAHFCGDETLRAAFAADQDIHRAVAAEVFDVPAEQVTPEQRGRAKTVNFGIIYGQTAFGLARTLRIPRGEAAEFIQRYKARFPRIDEYLSEIVDRARTTGYVETISGRRRAIVGLDARGPARAAAERLAINSTVQGSAADLIKKAMVRLHQRIAAEGRPSRMLLQIHDELVLEVPEDPSARCWWRR